MPWNSSNRATRLPSDWFTRIRPHILKRDPRCKLRYPGCTGVSTQVDHIQRGDDHTFQNLQGVCAGCHAKKSSREGHDAKRSRRARRLRPQERHPRDGLIATRPDERSNTDNPT